MIMAQMSEFQILSNREAGEIGSPILLEFSPKTLANWIFFSRKYRMEVMRPLCQNLCSTRSKLFFRFFNYYVNISYLRLSSDWFSKPSKQPRSNWTLELGYNDAETYPHRAYGSGTQFSLQIILRVYRENRHHLCSGSSLGLFRFMFSQPGESLHSLRKYYRVALGQTTQFTINPKLVSASQKTRQYETNIRGCYFNSERHLRFFKQYTQRNCDTECLTNFTLAQCGCVRFSMPSKELLPHWMLDLTEMSHHFNFKDRMIWEFADQQKSTVIWKQILSFSALVHPKYVTVYHRAHQYRIRYMRPNPNSITPEKQYLRWIMRS